MASTYAAAKRSILPSKRTSWGLTKSSSSVHRSVKDTEPFGPMMADEIFETHNYTEEAESCGNDGPWSLNKELPDDEEHWFQTELPLENVRDMERRLQNEIDKFRRCHRKMYIYALQWHYLMEECEDSEQIEKMFNDMQMIRKLTGSDKV